MTDPSALARFQSFAKSRSKEREARFEAYRVGLRRWDALVLRATFALLNDIRAFFAAKYLSGTGIEVGAQSNPLAIRNIRSKVYYIDRLLPEEIERLYGLLAESLAQPHALAEADTLAIRDNCLDFVICNHLLEHMEDPIGAVAEWLRAIKPGGVLFLSAPNYRVNEYDFERTPPSLDHVIADHENTSSCRKQAHWIEHMAHVWALPRNHERFDELLADIQAIDYRAHMHVFNDELVRNILAHIADAKRIPFSVVDSFHFTYGYELLFVVRKAGRYREHGTVRTTLRTLRNVMILAWFGGKRRLRRYLAKR